jgi:uncharacterized protein YukE
MTVSRVTATAEAVEARADSCKHEAERLDKVIRDLEQQSRSAFEDWTGRAADSLAGEIKRRLEAVRAAQEDLRRASTILRGIAADIRRHPTAAAR